MLNKMLNQKSKILIAGMLTVATVIGGSGIKSEARMLKDMNSKETVSIQTIDTSSQPDITKRFGEMNFLSQSEKQRLIDEKNAVKPYYNKIDSLEKEIRKISDNIMKDAKEILQEYDSIYWANMTLWMKLDSEVPETPYDKLPSNTERIKTSKVLTKSEKEILKNDAKRLDEIDAEIQKYYDKVEKATATLGKQIDIEYEKIEAINQKNSDIWQKIHKNMDGK